MFNLHRQKVLDECKWVPGKGQLRYIEAWSFSHTGTLIERNLCTSVPLLMLILIIVANAVTPDNYREDELNDEDVDDWLHQKGRFAPPSDPLLGKEEGSIRLLICERLGFHPLGFGLSKTSLLAVEDKLGLPTEMLPLFKFNGGGQSYYCRPSSLRDQEPGHLGKTVESLRSYSSRLT